MQPGQHDGFGCQVAFSASSRREQVPDRTSGPAWRTAMRPCIGTAGHERDRVRLAIGVPSEAGKGLLDLDDNN